MQAYEIKDLSSLSQLTGESLGTSDWRTVSQTDIDRFAEVTGDQQWIHLDAERTQRELGMPTIAHGYLTLSLLPVMMAETFGVKSVKRMINYGSNKIRFLAPVPAGARVRGHVMLQSADLDGSTMRAVLAVTVEIEGEDKPALHAEVITLMYE